MIENIPKEIIGKKPKDMRFYRTSQGSVESAPVHVSPSLSIRAGKKDIIPGDIFEGKPKNFIYLGRLYHNYYAVVVYEVGMKRAMTLSFENARFLFSNLKKIGHIEL